MAGQVTFQDTNQLISRGISGLYAKVFGIEIPLTAMGTLTNVVWTTGAQTISGNKTFAGNTTFAGGVSGGAITGSNLVYNTGNQSVQGIKTFMKNARFAEGMEITGFAYFHGDFYWSPDSTEEFNILGVGNFQGGVNVQQGLHISDGSSLYIADGGTVNVGIAKVLLTTGNQNISGVKSFINGLSGAVITGSNLVYNTGNQTISGIKTFASGISAIAVTGGNLVYNTGDQTISGNKTFSSGISAATVTGGNLVYNTGAQTISGIKSFVNGISGLSVTGANLVYNTGTQTISGIKSFDNNVNLNGTDNFADTLRVAYLNCYQGANFSGGFNTYGTNNVNGSMFVDNYLVVDEYFAVSNSITAGSGYMTTADLYVYGSGAFVGPTNRLGVGDHAYTDPDFLYIRRGDGGIILSTEEGALFSDGGIASVNFQGRTLTDSDGNTAFRWDAAGEILTEGEMFALRYGIYDQVATEYTRLYITDGDLSIGSHFAINSVGGTSLGISILDIATGAGISLLRMPSAHTGTIATREYIASGISGHPINTIPSFSVATGNQLAASNNGQTILVNATGTGTLIIIPSGLPSFFTAMFIRGCSGIPTFSGRAGVTIHNPYGDYTMPVSGCRVSIIATGTNAYNIV